MTTPRDSLGHRVAAIVAEYDAQGWHRTGTAVDLQSAEWLAGRVRALGVEASLEPFALERVEPVDAFVEFNGRRIQGVPLFDCNYTGLEGVIGRLTLAGGEGAVGLTEVAAGGDSAEFSDLRKTARHAALVAAVRPNGSAPGLALRNAEDFTAPFGLPTLQVAIEELPVLEAAASAQSEARVVVHARRVPSQAFNVVARVPGQDRALPPAWVMTPRSGWWWCAGERGGGIVCWLEALAHLKDRQPDRNVWFIATSGHELGHLGLRALLDARPRAVEDSHCWLHLGANIAAASSSATIVAASGDAIEQTLTNALATEGLQPAMRIPRERMPAGEAREIHLGGGRYVSLLGRHDLFHQEADRFPGAVNPGLLAHFARAVPVVVARLGSAEGVG